MCRVKAIASSVERLLRYANCSGSSEAGSTEQMCSLTSFSKHLLKMGVRATGLQSFKHVALGTCLDDNFGHGFSWTLSIPVGNEHSTSVSLSSSSSSHKTDKILTSMLF